MENRKGQVWQLLLPDLEGRTVLIYYKYTPKNWFHLWATAYPVTKGMSDYSFNYDVAENGMDYDLGLVYGWKLTNKFGIFLEGRYLNMYDVQSYESKVGFNWLIY